MLIDDIKVWLGRAHDKPVVRSQLNAMVDHSFCKLIACYKINTSTKFNVPAEYSRGLVASRQTAPNRVLGTVCSNYYKNGAYLKAPVIKCSGSLPVKGKPELRNHDQIGRAHV